jgi:hypothetical protein
VTTQLVRTPAERATGTAARQVSRRLAGLLVRGLMRLTVTGRAAGRVATRATIASTAERIRLLLADHVRVAATRLGALLPAAADSGGPDR